VVTYLRRTLRLGEADSAFLYVNSSFAPALDEVVGNLHRVSLHRRVVWLGKGTKVCVNVLTQVPVF